ncbi:MAG: HD domain-containing protein [Propionibacteriaceae bacterium]|jgi:dGTPase|nr:HD domain-containing protein [Propionibacteriaceae bacterium]
MEELTPREIAWATTMGGHRVSGVVTAHEGKPSQIAAGAPIGRVQREEREAAELRPGATRAQGAGRRKIPEEPDVERTCFERDRDRIVHSTAFRRLAGKTQVVVFPADHERTRLTHALEVAQVATSVARGVGANVTLTDAIALGHDCGHGPGGHASEDAFDAFIPGGYDHGAWGADVVLDGLNLCAETLDGIRNHSWSRPKPSTVEGEIVSWADRVAYCAHDLEDAVRAGIVTAKDIPAQVVQVAGASRREQLAVFIRSLISNTCRNGFVCMDAETAEALSALRAFNYERIYTREESLAQSRAVVEVLQALVTHYIEHPNDLPADAQGPDVLRAAVTYVAGMTDRFAFDTAVRLLDYDPAKLPKGIGQAC